MMNLLKLTINPTDMRKIFLKRKLKKTYLKVKNFKGYNCGHSMMLTMSSKYYNLCKLYNDTADKLSEIDDDCPSFRFSLK